MFETVSTSIKCSPEDVAKVVIMPGDPLRAKFIAESFLEDAFLFNDVRNMLGYTGFYQGKRISVMGSGMGIPSMVLYAHELYNQLGVEAIVRAGTCGGAARDVHLRDIIIAMSAATNSNMASLYDIPMRLAPTASWDMLKEATAAAERLGIPYKVGQVVTSDFFYNPCADIAMRFQRFGLLAVEMESAGLFLEAMASGKRAVSILACSDHIVTGAALNAEEREQTLTDMIRVSLECAKAFAK